MTTELSRPLETDRADGAEILVEANEQERAAVAARLGLPAIQALTCGFVIQALPARCFSAQLSLRARATLICAVSMEPFESALKENCLVRFVPAGQLTEGELDPDDDDEIPFEGRVIDLGEATVEQLALALPAYPKKPDAEIPEEAQEKRPNPFAILANRKNLQ